MRFCQEQQFRLANLFLVGCRRRSRLNSVQQIRNVAVRGDWLKRTYPEIGELPELDKSSVFNTCTFIIIGFTLFFFGIYLYAFFNSERNETITVLSLKNVNDQRLVYTDRGEYTCEDSIYFGNQNSYRIFTSLKQGKKYIAKVVGVGIRRNIIQVTPVEEKNNVRHQPAN